jgi:hypothetical protein
MTEIKTNTTDRERAESDTLAALATAYKLLDDTRVLAVALCRELHDSCSERTAAFYTQMLQCVLRSVYQKTAQARFLEQEHKRTPTDTEKRNSEPPRGLTGQNYSERDRAETPKTHAQADMQPNTRPAAENGNTTDPRKLYMQAAFARMVAAARTRANTLQTA